MGVFWVALGSFVGLMGSPWSQKREKPWVCSGFMKAFVCFSEASDGPLELILVCLVLLFGLCAKLLVQIVFQSCTLIV